MKAVFYQVLKKTPLLVGIIILSAVLWGSEYFSRTLWEPDEARYVYVAKEMRADSHWLVPHRSGKYYAHKPPLMFWMQNAASVTTGGVINQVSGRLPSLLGAILSLWAISSLAILWKERDAAWRVILILPTVYLFWKVCGMGQIDALLCGLEMMAIYLLFKGDDKTGSNGHRAFAYVFMGLAVIAKGPVGYIIPLGAYVTAQLFSGNKRQLKSWHFLWGSLIAILPLALWLLAAWRHGAPDGYFSELLFDQNAGRFAGTKIHSHHRPFWYFLAHFPAEFMPWTFFFVAAMRAMFLDRKKKELYKRLAGWIIFVVLFFSLSATKRNLYILLLYPAAALLIAVTWDNFSLLSKRCQNFAAYATTGFLLLLGVTVLGGAFYSELPIESWRLLPVSAIMLVGGSLLIALYRKVGLSNRWLITCCAVLLLNQLAVATIIYPGMNSLKSPLALAEAAKQHLPAGQDLLLYKTRGEIYALYCNAHGREVSDIETLKLAMKEQGKGMIVMSEGRWNEVKDDFEVAVEARFFQMGHKEFCWIEFDLTQEKLTYQ